MLFFEQDLVRKMEAAMARQSQAFADAAAGHLPELGVESLGLGGCARALYFGAGSVLSKAGGLGISAAATPEQIGAAEEFFFSRGDDCRVELCPLADPSLLPLLKERGYRITQFTNVYARPVPGAEEDLTLPAGVRVRQATGSDIEPVMDVIQAGFGGKPGDPLRRQMSASRSMPGMRVLGAEVEGPRGAVLAGGGSMAIVDGMALLFGAATLPEFRGRGVQTALLRRRLEMAREAGAACGLVIIQSRPGIPSERNIVRAGFRLAYTRPQVVRARPS